MRLKLLASNSRISLLELSGKMKMTPKTISSRIKELERKKVIIGYRTMFDLEKLGYIYFKLHFNLKNLNESKEKAIKQYFLHHPNIIFDNEILGGDDIEIEIQTKTLQEFRSIIEDIKNKFHDIIKEHKYMIFYKEHKFLWYPLEQTNIKTFKNL